jgi:triosephosphate isomerase (TIM)
VNQKTYFIANWKMNCAPRAACELAQVYCDQSSALHTERSTIIICPSFDALAVSAHIVAESPIQVGAQTVSPFAFGAHTGQIAAQSLSEIGCKYAIIGHSERRSECHETNQQIAQQLEQLIAHNIRPIICIGETEQEHAAGKSKEVLERQLMPLIPILQAHPNTHPIIAYEPVFAIGTGTIPEPAHLKDIFGWLKKHLLASLTNQPITLLYGGSVSDATIGDLKGIAEIQGFLIGSASLEFQKFQKIVSLWYTKK